MQLRLISPSLVAVSNIGSLGVVSRAEVGLGGGALVERVVAPNWSLQLDFDASALRTDWYERFDSTVVSVSPGVRWHPTRSSALTSTVRVSMSNPSASMMLVAHETGTPRPTHPSSRARDALRVENRLLLSLGLGPTATFSRSWGTQVGTPIDFGGCSLGARAVLAVGLVL